MPEGAIYFSRDTAHWTMAMGLVALWLLLTAVTVLRRMQRPAAIGEVLVVQASQTGHAGDFARAAQMRVEASGLSCALVEADALTPDMLAAARRLLFVASTTGEGEAPDNARRFERAMLRRPAELSGKEVALLALGDRRYAQFCGFGRRIGEWAARSGAEMLFPAVEVDGLNPTDLATWDRRLTAAGYPQMTALPEAQSDWRVAAREQVAGPSVDREGALTSDGLFRIALRPDGPMPSWEIGDLFELRTPDGHWRDYSIASVPGEDAVTLFVRRVVDKGVLGIGSGHITGADALAGRVRSHRSFRPPMGTGPLLAIGAGSGWAGLRPHVRHALTLGQPCRLIFGERASEADSPILAEMRELGLDRLDIALSRNDGAAGPYVQHVLAGAGRAIADFLGAAGRVVLCGRLAMGEQSLAALAEIMGGDWVEAAREDGRLVRDLY